MKALIKFITCDATSDNPFNDEYGIVEKVLFEDEKPVLYILNLCTGEFEIVKGYEFIKYVDAEDANKLIEELRK